MTFHLVHVELSRFNTFVLLWFQWNRLTLFVNSENTHHSLRFDVAIRIQTHKHRSKQLASTQSDRDRNGIFVQREFELALVLFDGFQSFSFSFFFSHFSFFLFIFGMFFFLLIFATQKSNFFMQVWEKSTYKLVPLKYVSKVNSIRDVNSRMRQTETRLRKRRRIAIWHFRSVSVWGVRCNWLIGNRICDQNWKSSHQFGCVLIICRCKGIHR